MDPTELLWSSTGRIHDFQRPPNADRELLKAKQRSIYGESAGRLRRGYGVQMARSGNPAG